MQRKVRDTSQRRETGFGGDAWSSCAFIKAELMSKSPTSMDWGSPRAILRARLLAVWMAFLALSGTPTLLAGSIHEAVSAPSAMLAIGDFWQSWEYLAGVMLLVACGIAGLYGYRLRRGMATTMEANRKNLETIQASEQRFRSLSSASPIGIFQAEMADKFVYTNRQWEEITGLGTPGLVGEAWRQLIHPEDLDRFQAAWLEMRQQRRDLNFESRLRTKGLGMRWVSIRAHPLPDTQECVGTMEDITTRKGAEAALQRTARDLESLYNQSPCGYHSLNHQGIITRINDTELSWLGYQREEVVRHKRFADILTPASRVQFDEQFGLFHVVNRGTSLEFELVRKDGTGLPVLMNASVIKDPSGALAALHCTVFDISERKRFELELTDARDAALQSARYKSEFLATMSHEIRTPMNGVIGMTGLLQGTLLTAEQMDYVSTIRSSSDSLLAIINDILDFSKIEAGKLTFEVLDFDLADVVDSTLDLLAEKAHAKRLELAGFIAPEVPTMLRGDADRLRQVLTNLVSNAVKFTTEGEVVVWVGREMETETHTRLRFEIKDSGIGIAPEAQARLFQPFQQADNSMSRKYGGTGLGLAICRQLVTMMQGDIGVDSEPGRGSSFWFTVNLEKQVVPPALPGLNSPLENRRVLVVDDNEASRLILKHQFDKWCSRVEVAASGEEALVKLRTAGLKGERFHIVIADQQMPGMDGLTLAAQIKADPSGARCRVVLLVSVAEKPSSSALQQAGVETCLTKPVRQSRLHDAVAASLVGDNSTQVVARRALKELPTPAAAPASTRKPRILLVEDNPINQRVALGLLGRLGTRADTAGNGIEALDILRHAPYDVILMDCQMPEMDGFEATTRIRQMEAERERGQEVPLASRVPLHIIALTANAMQGDRDRCLASGMNDYLSKPVKSDDLVRALERCPLVDAVPAPVPPPLAPEPEPVPTSAPVTPVALTAPALAPAGEPAAGPEEEEELVDLGRITDLTDGSLDEMRELVDLYMNQAAELSVKLEAVVAANNAREVVQVAHKWCGASSTCGITGLVDCLRELERMGRAGELTGAGELVAKAKARLDRIRAFWAEYFRSKQNG